MIDDGLPTEPAPNESRRLDVVLPIAKSRIQPGKKVVQVRSDETATLDESIMRG